jgi:hypothetical protein
MRLRWLLLLLGVFVALLLGWLRGGQRLIDARGAHLLVNGAVAMGIVIGVLLVLAAPLAWARLRAHVLRDLDGVYAEFQGQRIRLLEHNDALWLMAKDLHAALDLPPSFRPKGYAATEYRSFDKYGGAYSQQGVARLTQTVNDRKTAALSRWFEYDVIKPWQKRGRVQIEEPRITSNRGP